MVAVFGVEAAAIDKIYPTADHIASCESWTVLLACAAAPETVSIVPVVAIAVLVHPGSRFMFTPRAERPTPM